MISTVAAMVAVAGAVLAGLLGAPDIVAYVPVSGVLALAAVVLAGTGMGLARGLDGSAGRVSLRVLSWWWVLGGVVLIVVSMWSATAVLLYLADTAPDPARRVELRLEAVKTGLTVGAGAAGLVALLLGVRRQWLGERTQAYQQYDADEKRVTELYTKATDQLGHDKAAVRLAGLYALERVAQNNPEHRQTVVDVICAYLRMPPIRAGFPQGEPAEQAEHLLLAGREEEIMNLIDPQELQVRTTAQRILGNHLRWSRSDPSPPAAFWPDMDLDLTSAWLVKLDFWECRMRAAGFGGVTFEGLARFDGSTFSGRTVFGGAVFTGKAAWGDANYKAGFENVVFEEGAIFRETVFALRADFRSVTFEKEAIFSRTVFKNRALFRAAAFAGDAVFGGAAFKDEAVFRQARFDGGASFQEAAFATTPALWEATARAVPGTGRSWPEGWQEATGPDGPASTILVHGNRGGEPPEGDHSS
ncbi:pentapeptide repeat-containing protein [Sphaerisporangium perillae]|uniref:pentapeptide repeat-containing protein n=1 Tax=Sphaerisporangium perillae TaxID=2935860 RepID=UPI00200F2F3D|nr:pentapeptide repeat-containing protein [Sphaerisporangium perillae]